MKVQLEWISLSLSSLGPVFLPVFVQKSLYPAASDKTYTDIKCL